MPCTIKIRLVEARDLPVMDRTSKLADAYVGITFASFEAKSSVSKKTLNPKWDEEFRFDVADDSVLQSQPIEFKLMDHDVYTSDAVRVSIHTHGVVVRILRVVCDVRTDAFCAQLSDHWDRVCGFELLADARWTRDSRLVPRVRHATWCALRAQFGDSLAILWGCESIPRIVGRGAVLWAVDVGSNSVPH